MSERKQMTAYIPEQLHKALKLEAVSKDCEMSDIVSDALSEHLAAPKNETDIEFKNRMLTECKWYTKNRWTKISKFSSPHIANILNYLRNSCHEYKREYISRFEAELDARGMYVDYDSESEAV